MSAKRTGQNMQMCLPCDSSYTGGSTSIRQVLHGDCFEILPQLSESSVDLVFCDPPYNLTLGDTALKRWGRGDVVRGVREEWDRFTDFASYDEFIRRLFTECRRVMKPNGLLWVIGIPKASWPPMYGAFRSVVVRSVRSIRRRSRRLF